MYIISGGPYFHQYVCLLLLFYYFFPQPRNTNSKKNMFWKKYKGRRKKIFYIKLMMPRTPKFCGRYFEKSTGPLKNIIARFNTQKYIFCSSVIYYTPSHIFAKPCNNHRLSIEIFCIMLTHIRHSTFRNSII